MIFQLSFENNADTLILPVNPPQYNITDGGTSFNDFMPVGGGELSTFGNEQFNELSFSSEFPKEYRSYCAVDDVPDPWDAVEKLAKWRRSRKPVRVIISDTPINKLMTIRDFKYYEQGGPVGDLYYDIAFKDYRAVNIRKIQVKKDTPQAKADSKRPDEKPTPKTYTVKKGDNLWDIGRKFYGKGTQENYMKIFNANVGKVTKPRPLKDPHWIYPGQVLIIP